MRKVDAKRAQQLREKYGKPLYIRKEWKVDENEDITLEEFAEYVDPSFKYVEGNPVVVEKDRKDEKGTFNKLVFTLRGGSTAEYDLSYKHDFEEGDVLKLDTIVFRTEKFLEKEHQFATGELAE